jgi:hypothetical protein
VYHVTYACSCPVTSALAARVSGGSALRLRVLDLSHNPGIICRRHPPRHQHEYEMILMWYDTIGMLS